MRSDRKRVSRPPSPTAIARLCGFTIVAAVVLFALTDVAAQQSGPAIAPSGHSVTLTWQPTVGAKFYCIYRSTASKSGYQKIGTSPTPSYKDAPVPSGATFYYVVTAVGDKGESPYSAEIKAVVP